MFLVFRCRKCGRFLYAKASQKTKKCVCGHTNDLKRVIIVKKARDEREAGEIVRILQAKKSKSSGFTQPKPRKFW